LPAHPPGGPRLVLLAPVRWGSVILSDRTAEAYASNRFVVQPDTVVRWHRDWLRRRWTRRSQRRHHGRPPIDQQIRTLIREMATANPLWGAPRIHGELRTLGVLISERTVSRLLEPELSAMTFCTFEREFPSFRRQQVPKANCHNQLTYVCHLVHAVMHENDCSPG